MSIKNRSLKIFLKSLLWTLLGLSLAALGYFGTSYIFS